MMFYFTGKEVGVCVFDKVCRRTTRPCTSLHQYISTSSEGRYCN